MNIHEAINEKIELARTYLSDGAFHSAANLLTAAALALHDHADACDAEMFADQPAELVKMMRARLTRAEDEHRRALNASGVAKLECDAAAIAAAKANPHPLAGKRVKRVVRHGFKYGATRTESGIVKLNEERSRQARGSFYRINAGDWFVQSLSGRTDYCFGPEWKEVDATDATT